ncbi:TetR/AcrR family transcriptional regulator [Amycolatopsis jejuensis]|uniref:TetR/AcrR family transcriptional regulator n=1 Tax=Amycolatopsis jejuensis TaxID=330084 RepID=UPI00068A9B12|nr:TetR/AcrR family transcriptional regulator [Amycolatopsis jejuensis]
MPKPHDDADEGTHDRILRVAAEIFARKGYHGTGVAEIGDAAGIKRGALYYHIGSKEELLYDLSKQHIDEALARGRAVVERELDPVGKLRALAIEHVQTLAARRAEVTVVTREWHALTGERSRKFRKLRNEYENLFQGVLEEGVEQGVFRSADKVTLFGIMGVLNWTYVWFDGEHGELTAEVVAERLTEMIVYGELLREEPAIARS